ncbi:hypothetical protein V5N11_020034 [Cardamine amara subsp. amara]|uniref:Peptidase C19 ubiquitin carboxyl-terminal hydrolase domain-containing protein n=1 Tax=Cardamine amara subsp. amara TaxID=228776 RepID=A0ABD1A0T3_CARAN
MDSSNVQEEEKIEETDKNIDPDLSVTREDATEPMKLDATCVSAIDMIIKSLWQISVFTSQLANCQETNQSFTEDQLHDFILNNLSLTQYIEEEGISDLLVTIMDLLPGWRSVNGEEPLNSHIQVYEVVKRIAVDAKWILSIQLNVLMVLSSLRIHSEKSRQVHFYLIQVNLMIMMLETFWLSQAAFNHFTFEEIIKLARMKLKMPCDKEKCGKQSYVQRMINKLPSALTIALKWENNETEEEILDTTSVLATEIDITEIYKYEGDSTFTKYRLVSMVCLCGDLYNCVAYQRNSWVRYRLSSETEVIGDWESVLSMFPNLNVRPEILFYENVKLRLTADTTRKHVFNNGIIRC